MRTKRAIAVAQNYLRSTSGKGLVSSGRVVGAFGCLTAAGFSVSLTWGLVAAFGSLLAVDYLAE
jgi:hypothetical protein